MSEKPHTSRLSFDHGSLLLKQSALKPEGKFRHFRWDPRVEAHRAPAYCYSQILTEFRTDGIPIQLDIFRKQNPPRLKKSPELRPYQEAALAAWRDSKGRGIVVLPTGSGKTVLAIGAIAKTKLPTLCLVPTRVLLEQWIEILSAHFEGPIGILGDGKRQIGSITVATFESAYRQMQWLGNQFKLLIIDEVHHFGNGIRDEALEMAVCPFRLGLTATHVTEDSPKRRLCELVGPLIYQLSINELKGKYLAPFEMVTIKLDLSPNERVRYEQAMKNFRAFYCAFLREGSGVTWARFIQFSAKSKEGRMALHSWRRARQIIQFPKAKQEMLSSLLNQHRKNRVLIFTADTQTAYRIAEQHFIMPITADIKRREREEVLAKFKVGRLGALVSCRVLNEGMDVPDADLAIIVGGTQGEREHIQRIGRCLRHKEGKKAHVYELVILDTIEVRHWQKRTRTLASRIITKI